MLKVYDHTCKDFPPPLLYQNTNALIMNFSFFVFYLNMYLFFLKISVNFKCVILDFQYSNFIVEFKKKKGGKKKDKKRARQTFVFSRTKSCWCNQREKMNRMSEASVDDVIVLTYDVTACMCVNVHASVFICVPVCVTLSVFFFFFFFFFGMLNLIFRPNFPVAVQRPESRPSRVHINQ